MTASIESLTVSYRDHPVVRDVTFDVPANQVTGLLGPNGAGKSTVIKAMLGLVRPDRGRVLFDSRPLDDVRNRLAYLPQRAEVDWTYPSQVRDVVSMGRYVHLGPLRRRRRVDRVAIEEAIDRVGLTGLATRQIAELSGGQQQRVFLARALAQEATTLLLDEPFAAVDAPTVGLLTDLLRDLAAEGRSVLVVVHDLDAVGRLCDEVVVLNRTVRAIGAPVDVLLGPGSGASVFGGPRPADESVGGL